MEQKITKSELYFLFFCLVMGIVAEEAFFRDQIGLSYFIFIAAFYTLFFSRFRSFPFTHQRLGYLVLIAIWLLSATYFLYDSMPFMMLNALIIPALVILHLVLITSAKATEWSHPKFLLHTAKRVIDGFHYSTVFMKRISKLRKSDPDKLKNDTWKKVIIGVAISIPLLLVILTLLISADSQFERLVGNLPNLFHFNGEFVFRIIVVLLYTFGFFGFLQTLLKKEPEQVTVTSVSKAIDAVITLTVLMLINIVYVLFVAVQFKYFFSGQLVEGITYAEYARRGFFELLFVTLINLSITTFVIYFTKSLQGLLNKMIRVSLTVLVLASGVLLVSAFMRMMMYEDAYGYTFLRVLVTSFMIFLMLILAYTLVKIWLDRLSLFHFYFIAALVYYTGINVINIDDVVVDLNIARYEETGKIDINYLNSMSATGQLALVELYEEHPEVPGLYELLIERKNNGNIESLKSNSWFYYNLTRERAYEKLIELD